MISLCFNSQESHHTIECEDNVDDDDAEDKIVDEACTGNSQVARAKYSPLTKLLALTCIILG